PASARGSGCGEQRCSASTPGGVGLRRATRAPRALDGEGSGTSGGARADGAGHTSDQLGLRLRWAKQPGLLRIREPCASMRSRREGISYVAPPSGLALGADERRNRQRRGRPTRSANAVVPPVRARPPVLLGALGAGAIGGHPATDLQSEEEAGSRNVGDPVSRRSAVRAVAPKGS